MFRNNILAPEHDIVLDCKDKRYLSDIQVIDQAEANEFCNGENGFLRSMISQIMHAESEELRQSLLKKLVDTDKSSLPDNISAADAIRIIKPRSVQTAASCRDWLGGLENTGISKAVDAFVKEQELKRPKSVEPVEPVVKEDDVILDNV